MTQTLIDLGEIQAAPVPARSMRWYPRVWIFTAVLVAVLTLAGATRPSAGLAEVSTVDYPGTSQLFQLAADRLYVVDQGTQASAHLAAYRLPSGRALWDVALEWPMGRLVPVPGAGLLLSVAPDVTAALTVLDVGTGRVRWHSDASFVDVAPDLSAAVLAVSTAVGYRVDVVDLATGKLRWEWPAPDAAALAGPLDVLLSGSTTVDGTGTWWMVVREWDGVARVLDGPTGTALATGRLARPEDSPFTSGPPRMAAIGNLVVLAPQELGGVLEGYDVGTLRRRWRADDLAYVSYLDDCGALVCVGSDRSGLSGVDPLTGQVRWSDPERTQAIALSAGRLLAFRAPVGSQLVAQRAAILDAGTGRVLAQLGDWWWAPAGPGLGGGVGAASTSLDSGTLLVARPAKTLTSSFAVLDLSTGTIRPLGTLPLWPYGCQADGRYLACRGPDAALRVWRWQT